MDQLGRYILLEAGIQDSPFILLNIYAPYKPAEQCEFFSKLSDPPKSQSTDSITSLIVGGM